jgi:hypothetical protein
MLVAWTTSAGRGGGGASPFHLPARLRVQVIAQRLLVEARLRAARRVLRSRPESGAVGCQHFVNKGHASRGIAAELELGVCDDNTTFSGHAAAKGVNAQAQSFELARVLVATQQFGHPLTCDVLVVAGLGLGCRAENGRLEMAALKQPRRELFASQCPTLAVLLPG